MKQFLALFFLFFLGYNAASQHILPESQRARVVDELLKERLDSLLPVLMDRTGIDMWVLISREYNEDPVLRTMLPATWLNARRRTMLLFYRDASSGRMDKLAVARYNIGESIQSAWDKEQEPDQWKRLMDLIRERNPKRIGLNFSADHNIGAFDLYGAPGTIRTCDRSVRRKIFKLSFIL